MPKPYDRSLHSQRIFARSVDERADFARKNGKVRVEYKISPKTAYGDWRQRDQWQVVEEPNTEHALLTVTSA
jgi:hypothetical protein